VHELGGTSTGLGVYSSGGDIGGHLLRVVEEAIAGLLRGQYRLIREFIDKQYVSGVVSRG
jgi:hypothetical protein